MDLVLSEYGTGGLITCCLCSFICVAVSISLPVFMGIYAWGNPDKDAWYGLTPESKHALFEGEDQANESEATDIVHIHARFIAWFTWGFIMLLPVPLISIASICIMDKLCGPGVAAWCAAINSCGGCLTTMAWWTYGIVLRWSATGAFASGDIIMEGDSYIEWHDKITEEGSLFQVSSGRFIAIFYFISWGLLATCCFGSLLVCCYFCRDSKKY